MADTPTRTIDAVSITVRIIESLQSLHRAGVTEISNEIGHSKSTVHSHLATLEHNRLVVKEDQEYRLSLRFLDIGDHVRNQFGNYDIIKSELTELAEETGEVAQFGIPEHDRVSYLYKAVGDQGVQTASRVGTQQYLHSTSLGKAVLAHLPRDEVEAIIDRTGLPKITENTVQDRGSLWQELEETRNRGYAVDDEENVSGLRCIAAPVLNDDDIFGAVSLSGPSSRLSGDLFTDELPAAVRRTANVIELNSKFAT